MLYKAHLRLERYPEQLSALFKKLEDTELSLQRCAVSVLQKLGDAASTAPAREQLALRVQAADNADSQDSMAAEDPKVKGAGVYTYVHVLGLQLQVAIKHLSASQQW